MSLKIRPSSLVLCGDIYIAEICMYIYKQTFETETELQ